MQYSKNVDLVAQSAFIEAATNHLDIALQPIVEMSSGRIHAYEALVRNTKQIGVDSPAELHDLALEKDCLFALEKTLWEKACRKFTEQSNMPQAQLFINVDGRSLIENGTNVVDAINDIAAEAGLLPGQTCLELSEMADVSTHQTVADVRSYAKKKCLKFIIDDFGKGYSQLKIMHELEPDLIKVDRFFIEGIDRDSRKHLLVSSIVQLAHRLGMRVVVEGIETSEELRACQSLNADFAQGYFIGRPQTALGEHGEAVAKAIGAIVLDEEDGSDPIASDALEKLPFVQIGDGAEGIINKFKLDTTLRLLPVVNDQEEPVGIIREENLRNYLYNPYGHMLLRNNGILNVVDSLIRKVPIADHRTPLSELVPTGAISDAECILVTQNGRYVGVVTTQTLLKTANDDRIKQAEDQNPLTRLPGNRLIDAHIQEFGQRPETERYFFYFDFDTFKPFNDAYGFSAGDRVIQLFGDILRTKLAPFGAFLGHVGGDDFFVGFHDIEIDRVIKEAQIIREEFSKATIGFYSPEDQQNGYTNSVDRHGRQNTHGLLSCSVGVAQLKQGETISSLDRFGFSIGQIKKAAKVAPHGVVVGDANGFTSASPVNRLHERLLAASS
ncbi:MAG: GGDEF domain-containing protein [Pseudomonadota bacterium]